MSDLKNFGQQARAKWKLSLSFLKKEWTIDDYPIDVRHQSSVGHELPSRRKLIPWTARVINWPGMSGAGETRSDALDDLRQKIEGYKIEKGRLPRPGTTVPIEFASTERIDRHPELRKDFVRRVLDLEWAWISDESSLWDFHTDKTNEKLIEKIRSTYGVDVSDIPSGSLADIFDRIAAG